MLQVTYQSHPGRGVRGWRPVCSTVGLLGVRCFISDTQNRNRIRFSHGRPFPGVWNSHFPRHVAPRWNACCVIRFFKYKKKKKSNQKFITDMVRIWWLKIISPQSALVWCAHLGTGRTHQGIWTREWHQKSTGAYLLIWLTSNSCPTCAKIYLTLLKNKWFKNCGY